MRYNKPPTSFEEQADRLLARGLIADRQQLIQFNQFPEQPLLPMGLGPDWRRHPLWFSVSAS
jgi:hypothetical protein